ncbi:hypothetical protein L6164_002094 [Bauhinia variegata]|uniref:Uncharacterized protein n=2 Tax=Bauhinia variegata TaxID=167791 RepID=A0ACB9PWZ8_BAUVA|nr:hypothetical protein L6164_002094 [Bauhinia variegata]
MAAHILCVYLWLPFVVTIFHYVPTLAQSENYIVTMDSSAMPKAFSSKHSWYLATLSSALDNSQATSATFNSSSPNLIYSYTHVINGFSAHLSLAELEALKSSPGFVSAIPDLPIKRDTTHTPQFIGLNPNSGAWPAAEFGRDVIIGVVDSGIWPESESYKDDGISEIPSRWKGECEIGTQFNSSLCNKKLIGARYFNKGLVAHNPNITISMNSTRDTEGHGTHTSSTAAGGYVGGASYFGYASGLASGVAPRAHLAMYKALWEEGAYSSDIIAAIDSAIEDGVDVISLSLGLDDVALYEDPVAIATFSALYKGIFVSTSAGNEGPNLEVLHNGTPWVITAAAAAMDREFQGTLKLGNGVAINGSSLYPGSSSAVQAPIVYMGSCDDVRELAKVSNSIVVCEDKNDTLDDEVAHLSTANVTGGVFISNSTDIKFYSQISYPAVFLDPKNGEIVKDYLNKSSNPKASFSFGLTILGTKPAPAVDSYSSRGPSQSCPFVLKPDISAPGTLVLAAWPPNVAVVHVGTKDLFSNFNLISGTSMSCPHVTGVAALLKGAHPEWSPAAIRSAIMTTSDSLDNTQEPIKDVGDDYSPASPLAMGAGHINPNKAIDPGLVYDADFQDYVNLLCALNFTQKNIATITKSSFNNCSNPSLDLNYPSFIAFFNDYDKAASSETRIAKEFQRTVTNVGNEGSTYVASVTTIDGFEISVIPNRLIFKGKNEKLSFKLRIQGPRLMKENVAFGYLTWKDQIHVVRSPIVVTSLRSVPISSES